MDRITELEGIEYFFDHLEESGAIRSRDNSIVDLWAMHSKKSWKECLSDINNVRYRYMVGKIRLVKTTKTKAGLFNHVFSVEY